MLRQIPIHPLRAGPAVGVDPGGQMRRHLAQGPDRDVQMLPGHLPGPECRHHHR
jgi:hypothetical protein